MKARGVSDSRLVGRPSPQHTERFGWFAARSPRARTESAHGRMASTHNDVAKWKGPPEVRKISAFIAAEASCPPKREARRGMAKAGVGGVRRRTRQRAVWGPSQGRWRGVGEGSGGAGADEF